MKNRKTKRMWRELAILLIPVLLFLGWIKITGSQNVSGAELATHIQGLWKSENGSLPAYLLFRADGTFENISFVPDSFEPALGWNALKGRYEVSDHTITLHDFRRYVRSQRDDKGEDKLWDPGSGKLTNGPANDMASNDNIDSARGLHYEVIKIQLLPNRVTTQTATGIGGVKKTVETKWRKQSS